MFFKGNGMGFAQVSAVGESSSSASNIDGRPWSSTRIATTVLIATLLGVLHLLGFLGAPAGATDTPTTSISGVVVSPYGGADLAVRNPVSPAWVLLLAWQEGHGWIDYRHPESRIEVLTSDGDDAGKFSMSVPSGLLDGRQAALLIAPSPELAVGSEPLGVAIVPIDLPAAPESDISLGRVALPAPNVLGQLLDIPSRGGSGLNAQSVGVRSVDTGGGSLSSTVQTSWTSSTGNFAFAVNTEDLVGGSIHIQTDWRSPFRIGFEVPISSFVDAAGVLPVQYSEPDVAGTLTAGGLKVDERYAYLERNIEPDGDSWTFVAYARTDTEGRFWFTGGFAEPGPYRLRFDSVSNANGAFPAFDIAILPPAAGEVREVTVAYPEPNMTGTLTADVPAAGTAVESANIVLYEIIDRGDWVEERWLNRSSTTDATGAFGFFLSDAQIEGVLAGSTRIEMRVSPPHAQRGVLPPFTKRLEDVLGSGPTVDDLKGLGLVFPTPNVTGVLRRTADGDPIPNSWVVVQRRVVEYGEVRWDWTSLGTSSADDGSFAFVLPDLGSGTWRLRFQVPTDTGLLRFTVPLASDAIGLNVVVPTPNLSGTVTDSAGNAVPNAWVDLRRFVDDSGDGWWNGTGVTATTNSAGEFGFALSAEELAGTLQLRVTPPSALLGSVSAFTFAIPSSGPLVDLAVTAPEPDLVGTLTTPAGAPVRDAHVVLQREVVFEGGAYWEWTDASAMTSAAGEFALTLEEIVGEARYRLAVRPPWNRRSELVGFTVAVPSVGPGTTLPVAFPAPNVAGVVLDAGGSVVREAWLSLLAWNEAAGFWEHVADASTDGSGTFVMYSETDGPHRISVSGYLQSGGYSEMTVAVDITDPGAAALELRFPTPNLSTRIVDSDGSGLRRAWVWVERLFTDGEIDFSALEGSGTGGSTDREGEIGLRVGQPGDYRLHVSPPWGRSMPSFTVDFQVADDLTVTGIDATLAFPEPNLVIDVVGPLNGATAALRDALIEIRVVDPVDGVARYTNLYSQTDRDGRAALRLLPGVYRIYVHPPWYGQQLGFAELEITILDGGPRIEENVTLRSPNVRGSVQVTSGVPASWSWIEIETVETTPVSLPGVHVRRDGTFATGLGDGEYLLRVWSSHARASSGPLEAFVTIESDEVVAWRYVLDVGGVNCDPAADTCLVELSFDDTTVRPNVTGTVTRGGADGDAVSNTFLIATATGPGSGGTPATWTRTIVTGSDGTFSLLVPTDIEFTIAVVLEQGMTVERVAVPGTFAAGDTDIVVDVDATVGAG